MDKFNKNYSNQSCAVGDFVCGVSANLQEFSAMKGRKANRWHRHRQKSTAGLIGEVRFERSLDVAVISRTCERPASLRYTSRKVIDS